MFESIWQKFGGEARQRREPPELVTLRSEEVTSISLAWNSRFNTPTLRQHLQEYPGLSLKVRGHDEYIIGDNWRRHEAVAQIVESKARVYRAEMVSGLVEEFKRLGFGAVVVSHEEHSENMRFYEEAGFYEIEKIVYYEKPEMQTNFRYSGREIALTPARSGPIEDLLGVDHAAFPWLWWNSRKEMDFYLAQPDVTIFLGYDAATQQPLGYFGFTTYDRWAHLDRLAVIPETQGQRVGAYLLMRAISMMADQGARRVTLSTQLNNHQSQRLYEGFGFQRVKSLEYSLTGRWLNK